MKSGTKLERKMGDLVRAILAMVEQRYPFITLFHTLFHTLFQLNYLYISTLYYNGTKGTKYLSNKFIYSVD